MRKLLTCISDSLPERASWMERLEERGDKAMRGVRDTGKIRICRRALQKLWNMEKKRRNLEKERHRVRWIMRQNGEEYPSFLCHIETPFSLYVLAGSAHFTTGNETDTPRRLSTLPFSFLYQPISLPQGRNPVFPWGIWWLQCFIVRFYHWLSVYPNSRNLPGINLAL